MNKICAFAPVAGALVVSGSAFAGLIDIVTEGPVTVTPVVLAGSPAGSITYQIFADLGGSEQLLGVSAGDAGMIFESLAAIINDTGSAFFGLVTSDLPTGAPFGAAWDTYVSIGDTSFPTDSQLSPGFLGGDGVTSVIHGTSFSEPIDGGGWFDSNPGTADGLGGGLIFNLTLPADAEFYWQGELGYSLAEGGGLAAAFVSVEGVPAPGALALLGLAGLVGTRRRRG